MLPLVERSRQETRSAALAPTLWLMLVGSVALMMTAYATDPSWWTSIGNTTPRAVVVQGQLKWFTATAVANLNAQLTNTSLGATGAGSALDMMITSWSNEYYTNGNTAVPSDKQVVTIGQLKYIASLYYTQLGAAGYTSAWPGWLYPDPANDSQMAVVGQLKSVFNFDLNATLNAPGNVTSTILGDGSINVTWSESSSNITGFTLEYSNDGTTWTAVPGATLTAGANDYTIPSGTSGISSTTQFQVVANNAAVNSGSSSSATSSTTTPVPGVPTGLTGTLDTNNAMNLSWSAVTGASSYTVQSERLDGTTWTSVDSSVGSTSYADSARSYGYGYRYRVLANSSGGTSGASSVFPQVQYAAIDLGAVTAPLYINNGGSVVYAGDSGGTATYNFWKAGVSTPIPLASLPPYNTIPTVGLNDNDVVAGNEIVNDPPFTNTEFNPNEYNTNPPNYNFPPVPNNYTTRLIHTGLEATTWTSTGGLNSIGDGANDAMVQAFGGISLSAQMSGAEGSATSWIETTTTAAALSDSQVVGSGWISGIYPEFTGWPPHTWIFSSLEGNMGLQWTISGGGSVIGAPFWDDPDNYVGPFDNTTYFAPPANSEAIWPIRVNDSGHMVVSYSEYNGSDPSLLSCDFGYWDGTTLHPLTDTPVDINNNDEILSYSGGNMIVEGVGTLSTSASPVKINNASPHGQVMDTAGWLWTYNTTTSTYTPQNIADYAPGPNDSSWSGFFPETWNGCQPFNDSGAIIGQATNTNDGQIHALVLIPVQLDQVTFSGTGWYGVVDDNSGLEFYSEHDDNQWQEPNPSATDTLHQQGWTDPICYSSGSTMTAAVQLKVSPGSSVWSAFSLKIKGVGTGTVSAGYDFTNTDGKGFTATYSSTGNTITASGMTCAKAFPSTTVGYINPLTIQWYISTDGGNTWNGLNQSKDELFITLNSPTLDPTSDGNYKLFQTVLHYACSDSGATTAASAVANTWSLFTSSGTSPANIKAWNPTDKSYDRQLYYYGASRGFGGSQPVSTTALLAATDGDGECYSFGQLFQDALWANGISNTGIIITPTVSGLSFLVKDLTPSTTGSLPADAPFSWRMAFSASVGEMQPPPSTATTYGTYGDFVNLSTHKGQNTAPPLEKVFGNHYIVQYGSGYYDPSYGATYTGANNFEDQSVQDYCAGISGDSVNLALRPSSGLHIIQFQPQNTPHE